MAHRATAAVAIALCLPIAACGGDDALPTDAGLVPDAADPPAVTPPDLPWLDVGEPPVAPPALAPCLDGWSQETDDDGLVRCEPWPSGEPPACPPGEAPFAGEAGCTPVGAACPTGSFHEGLPADRPVVYVLSTAPAGGDGTAARPYASLLDVRLAGLPSRGIIALGPGRYDRALRLTDGIGVWGACASRTELVSSEPATYEGVIMVAGAGVEVRDLRIGPSPRPGVYVFGAGLELTLGGVQVAGTERIGVFVSDGATLHADGLAVSDTQPSAGDGTFGSGIDVERGSTVEARRVVLSGNHLVGMLVAGAGSSAVLENIVIADTRSQESDGLWGTGLSTRGGGAVTVRGALFVRNRGGVGSDGDTSSLRVEDAVIRSSLGWEIDGSGGRGVSVGPGTTVELRRLLVSNNREVGVWAGLAGTTLLLEDAAVVDTQSEVGGRSGQGMSVETGAIAVVRRTWFARNRLIGIAAVGEGSTDTSLTAEDLFVRDTRPRELDAFGGRAVEIESGAVAQITRALIERNHEVSVFVSDADSVLDLEDVAVRDSLSRELDRTGGRGIVAQVGAAIRISRALVERSRGSALASLGPAAVLDLEDVVVRDTLGEEVDGQLGRALGVQQGALATVRRVVLERSRNVALFAGLEGAVVDAQDLQIRDSSVESCTESGACPRRSSGDGVGVHEGAAVSIDRFLIANAQRCGAQVATDSQLDLSNGEVTGCVIGACIQIDGFDTDRLTREVVFHDNEVNLQATSLPVPDPVELDLSS